MQQNTNIEHHHHHSLLRIAIVAVVLMVLASSFTTLSQFVFADERFDNQARFAEESAQAYEEQADTLNRMAENYELELEALGRQSAQIQTSLTESEAEYAKLEKEVSAIEKKLKASREELGSILISMQIDSEVSPLEMIASSTSIGEYVDRHAHQTAIRQSIDTEIVKINDTRKELEERKSDVARVVESQKNQKEQLAQKEAKQQTLVAQTRGEADRYRELAEANNLRIQQLREEQAELNRRAAESAIGAAGNSNVNIPPGILGGDYPFTKGPLDYGVDPWGLYYRECVSYAAWKVASTGRFVPHFGGRGNANEWPTTVARFGISNGKEPRAGSVAMQDIGVYGHVMYVEKVNDDNTIVVSDYNLAWDGLYRKYTRSSGGLTYIYF